MNTATITEKGQITIPKKIRDALNLKPSDKIIFVRRGNTIILKPVADVVNIRGIVKTEKCPDSKEVREQTQQNIAERIANE